MGQEQETRTAREAAGEAIELACPRVTGDRVVLSQSESDLLADAALAALDAAGFTVERKEVAVCWCGDPTCDGSGRVVSTPEGGKT